MLTFQWTATVIFDHLNGFLQNQKLSVAVMSVSTSECPDDPEGKLWQSIAMEVSINGAQKSWMVYFMENPIYKWMTTGGTLF